MASDVFRRSEPALEKHYLAPYFARMKAAMAARGDDVRHLDFALFCRDARRGDAHARAVIAGLEEEHRKTHDRP